MKTLLTAVVLSIVLAGCGGGSSDTGSGGGALLGTYRGTTASTVIVYSSPITIFITADDGLNIAGRLEVPNSPCFPSAAFTGTRNGSTIEILAVNGGNILFAALVQNGNTLSGNYVVQQGGCIGDAGTVTASK